MADDHPLFVAYNVHIAGSGTPPKFDNRAEHKYFGYFENEHGEQWVFVYDYQTDSGTVQGGDAGWDEKFDVVDGWFPDSRWERRRGSGSPCAGRPPRYSTRHGRDGVTNPDRREWAALPLAA